MVNDFLNWAWARHDNLLSSYIRPLFVLPFCYFAYRKSAWGVALTIVAVFSSMFWFPPLAATDPRAAAFLAMERRYITGSWTLNKDAMTALVPVWFIALAWAFWRRSWPAGFLVIDLGALLKVIWSSYFAGSGALSIIPAVGLGALVINGVMLYAYQRVRRRAGDANKVLHARKIGKKVLAPFHRSRYTADNLDRHCLNGVASAVPRAPPAAIMTRGGKMRRFLLAAFLLAGFIDVLRLGLYDPLHGRAEFSDPDRRLAALLLDLSEQPYVRRWLKRSLQLVQNNLHLAQFVDRVEDNDSPPRRATAEDPFRLTFPHAPNGQAGDFTITLSVIVINNSGADTAGKILVRQDDGGPMEISTNLGVAGEFDFVLPPGEILRLETDGIGDLRVGWIEVVSDVRLSGSGTFSILDAGGAVLSKVGIGDSIRGDQLMIFVDTTQGKNTGFAVCNPDPETAVGLVYELRRLDGTPVASVDDELPPLGQTAQFVTEAFPPAEFPEVDFSNFRGVLVVSSQDVDVSLVTLRTRGVNFTSLQPAGTRSGTSGSESVRLYFARIGDGIFGGLGFQSSVILLNNSASDLTAVVEFFKADGLPLAVRVGAESADRFTVQIPAGGGVELLTDGSTDPGVTGWARVSSAFELDGSATFTITDRTTGAFVSEVGVPDSRLTPVSVVSARELGPISTGVGLTNPADVPVEVRLRLIEGTAQAAPAGDGVVQAAVARRSGFLGERIVELPARGHTAAFVFELFSQVPSVQQRNFEGRLELEAFLSGYGEHFPVPISGITLLARGTLLTSLPTPELVVNFRPVLSLEAGTNLPGATPALCLSWRQQEAEMPVQNALIRIENGELDLSGLAEGESLGRFLLYSGELFVREVDSDGADFYTSITFDGSSEAMPFYGEVVNIPEGGVEVRIENNAVSLEPLLLSSRTTFCLNPGLFRLPHNSSGAIPISERYQSLAGPDELPFTRTVTGTLELEDLAGDRPRIHAVEPHRVVAGRQVLIYGRGFSPVAANNQVLIAGDFNLPGQVEEATTELLTVRLPDRLPGELLSVEVQGARSNTYRFDRAFAPEPAFELSSLQAGQAVVPRIRLLLREGDVTLGRFRIESSGGEWVLDGLEVGRSVGTVRATLAGTDEELEVNDLLVASIEGGTLTLEAVDEDAEVQYLIEITNQGQPSFFFRTASPALFSAVNIVSITFDFEFTAPLFQLPPGGGSGIDFFFSLTSLPERTNIAETELEVEVTRTVTNQ